MSLRDAGDEWQPSWLCVLPVSVCHSQCDRLVCVCVCVCVCLSVYMPSSSRKVALTKRPTRDASHCAGHATAYSYLPVSPRISPDLPCAGHATAYSQPPPSIAHDTPVARCPAHRGRLRPASVEVPLPHAPASHTARRVRHEHGGRTTGERGSRARAPAAGPKSAPPWEGCSASQPSTLSGPPARTVEYSLMD